MGEHLLEIKDLYVEYVTDDAHVYAVNGIDLFLDRGETLGLVGETGAGKTTTALSILKLLPEKVGRIAKGSIRLAGTDVTAASEAEMRLLRGETVSMIFQDPMTSLNPLKSIGWQIGESLKYHQNLTGEAAKNKVMEMLTDVGIDDPKRRYSQYPHEFSGGMRQRVAIAIALACNPRILVCDEPTTALDVTIQAQILDLVRGLQKKYQLTTIYITHDLGVVANVADRVAVMYAGDIVEIGGCKEIFFNPKHPYTWALLSSLPQIAAAGTKLYSIHGTPPNLFMPVRGDAFAPRNPYALDIDFLHRPPYFEVSPTHKARTWLLDPRAPKIDPPEAIREIKNLKAFGGDWGEE